MMEQMPRIEAVSVEGTGRLAVKWRDKTRKDTVNLLGWIATGGEILAPLMEPTIFSKAAVGNYGTAIVWDDGDLAIDAQHVMLLADEQKKFDWRDAKRWQEQVGLSNNEVADLFKLQDLVVARLASSFHFELIAAEAARDVGVKSPDAIDFVMRGKALWFQAIKRPSKEGFEAVIDILGRALAIDPNEAEALAYQAQAYVIGLAIPVFPWDKGLADKALGEADRAIALEPNTQMAYHVKSMYLTFFGRRADKALRIADEGLAINPNYTPLFMSRQFAEMGLGQFGQARSDIEEFMRLSPRDPGAGVAHQQLGFAEFGLGHFEASAEEFSKAIDAGWRPFTIYVGLAAAYAAQNKTLDAKAALDEARKADPNVTIKHMAGRFFDMPGFFEALKKAGVPEE